MPQSDNWKPKNIDLGKIKVGETHNLLFSYTSDDITVLQLPDKSFFLVPSCGCTKPTWNPTTQELKATYTAQPIPLHLKKAGKDSYIVIKSVSIHLKRGDKEMVDVVTFTANVSE
jgi:hypothetical protein